MSFGIILKAYNYSYFKEPLFIYADVLPQFIFMQCIFGYLSACIIYKWSVDWWETDADGNLIHNSPPGLLNVLISMFLTPGVVNPEEQLYPGQVSVFLRHNMK